MSFVIQTRWSDSDYEVDQFYWLNLSLLVENDNIDGGMNGSWPRERMYPLSIFLAFRTQREDDAWLRSMTNVKKACLFQHPAGYSLFRMKEKTLKSVRYYILRTTETGKLNQKWTSV